VESAYDERVQSGNGGFGGGGTKGRIAPSSRGIWHFTMGAIDMREPVTRVKALVKQFEQLVSTTQFLE
jgi:hypothetical protein